MNFMSVHFSVSFLLAPMEAFLLRCVADFVCSLFYCTNISGNDECFGCIVQLKAALNRTKGSQGDATIYQTFKEIQA